MLSLIAAFFVSTVALAQAPLGFRTDGTGRYPDANPPLHWGPNKNVVWNIKLTQSNAIPVILNSAYSSYQESFLSWSADAYVIKSSDLTELKTRIRIILATRSNS